MFTTPAPAPPTVSARSVSPPSVSYLRPRLRDLSASLRNYRASITRDQASHTGAAAPDHSYCRTTDSPSSSTTSRAFSHQPSSSAASQSSHPSSSLWPAINSHARTSTAPEASLPQPSPTSSFPTPTMTRTRAETAAPSLSVRNQTGPTPASPSLAPSMAAAGTSEAGPVRQQPTIRFIPHQDPRPGRPSLQFPTMSRTLPDESAVIRVGRYSERDNMPELPPNMPTAAPVGFKSKVVSRKHCELWCKDGQWYIKDVSSSSGTFLNRIRLSQPNSESKPHKIKDGDIIQLGIDFRGGEEMIFRCVKIRVECNRGWQQSLNTFNKQTHQRLRNLAKKKESDSSSVHTSECCICLMSIAPCQSLFVAPCSHVWHYKCIRPILNGPTWPTFLCPNCRAVADLEADVEEMGEFEQWDDVPERNEESQSNEPAPQDGRQTSPPSADPLSNGAATGNADAGLSDLAAAMSNHGIVDASNAVANEPIPSPATPERFITPAHSSSVTQPVAIQFNTSNAGLSPMHPNSTGLSAERASDCPMTPRNDVGPFVLDGAGRPAPEN